MCFPPVFIKRTYKLCVIPRSIFNRVVILGNIGKTGGFILGKNTQFLLCIKMCVYAGFQQVTDFLYDFFIPFLDPNYIKRALNKITENFVDIDSLEGLIGSFILKDLSEFYASKKYLDKYGVPKNINDLLENHNLYMSSRYINLPEYQGLMKRAKHLNTTSDSLALIYRLVNDGDGITVFPSWFEEYSKDLVCIDDLDFDFETEIQCICRTEIAESPRVQAFVNFFIDFCTGHNVPIDIYY